MREFNEVEHKRAFDAIGLALLLLQPQQEYLARLVNAERSMHEFMHIVDPTTYIRALNSDSLRQQVELATAAVQKIRNELTGSPAGGAA